MSLFALFLLGRSSSAQAHADSKINIRAIHLEYHHLGMTAYYRLSFPLVAAAGREVSTEESAFKQSYPYVISRLESGHTFHYADPDGLAHGLGLAGALVASGHRVTVAGSEISPEVVSAAAHARGNVPPFSTLEQARQAVLQSASPDAFRDVDIENVLIDVAILYRAVRNTDQIEISSTLDPAPLSEAPVKNVVVSHAEGRATTYSRIGLLDSPMTINPSIWTTARQFIAAGITHIVQGVDHLIFVACLALGAPTLRAAALRITAFSAGHAISMVAAYFGLVPDVEWFSGAIELAIALSVLGSAIVLLVNRMTSFHASSFALAFGIVHGLGFAFGIRELMADMGANVIISFLSFSLGGEAVQVVFGAGIWALSRRFSLACGRRQASAHVAVAIGLVLVAGFWVVERSVLLWEMMRPGF
ncbi:MAG TPA: HupE/UreJ family protein [Noviherbaspirillum sp.]|nr:HupE/UreJ family protein [Noviherbaspirillum sp.]